ncbi:Cu/Ag efflux protein CusF [Anaerotaenia torta]|uniref:DUF4363 family protein n=1 Tax=Anaerotaenia torta TaxID=433293 RepID=UPI003D23E90B
MKNIVISLMISVIMIMAMSFSIKYLNKVSQDLGRLNDEIEHYIADDNWDEAYKASIDFTEKWIDYSKKIKLYLNHQEIDNIEMELMKLPQYIKEMTKDESLASVHVLKFLVDHISELEKIKLQNIF